MVQNASDEAALTGAAKSPISEQEMTAALGPSAPQSARDAIIAKLPTTSIDDHGTPRTRYVWEGDMLLSREEVNGVLRGDVAPSAKAGLQPELKVMVDQQGRPTFWPKGQRSLTYAIDRASFPNGAVDRATKAMAQAAHDWEKACPTCGLTIREVPSGRATFTVRYQKQNVPYIAASFFPADAAWQRVLFIAAPFYTMSEDPAGVLRHELGHVLGYRHEHIGGVPGCGYEDSQWIAVTPYDPKSVMHYPCGGGGTLLMQLSPSDITGHKKIYS